MYVLVKETEINDIGGLRYFFLFWFIPTHHPLFLLAAGISAFKQVLLLKAELLLGEIWLSCLLERITMESLEIISVLGIKIRTFLIHYSFSSYLQGGGPRDL